MTNHLRIGVILAVTGILALLHYFLSASHVLPGRSVLFVGVSLVVSGVPFLAIAARRLSSR